MDDTKMRVLHWRPEENRWLEIDWDDFAAFRALFTPFRPLADVGPGVHHFVVCACGEEQTWNIISTPLSPCARRSQSPRTVAVRSCRQASPDLSDTPPSLSA
jgi:hypothetical protein